MQDVGELSKQYNCIEASERNGILKKVRIYQVRNRWGYEIEMRVEEGYKYALVDLIENLKKSKKKPKKEEQVYSLTYFKNTEWQWSDEKRRDVKPQPVLRGFNSRETIEHCIGLLDKL